MSLQAPPGVAVWPSDLQPPRRGAIEVATQAWHLEVRQYRFAMAEALLSHRTYPSQPWAPVLVGQYRITRQATRQYAWCLADAAQAFGLDTGLELV